MRQHTSGKPYLNKVTFNKTQIVLMRYIYTHSDILFSLLYFIFNPVNYDLL